MGKKIEAVAKRYLITEEFRVVPGAILPLTSGALLELDQVVLNLKTVARLSLEIRTVLDPKLNVGLKHPGLRVGIAHGHAGSVESAGFARVGIALPPSPTFTDRRYSGRRTS